VFVFKEVILFQEGATVVAGSSDDHSAFRGRHGWFILVRGMVKVNPDSNDSVSEASTSDVSSNSESDIKPSVLEPGAMIGMIEQLLGSPMKLIYQTSSYCHLIFIDTVEYLKKASPFRNVRLHQALFRAMGQEMWPDLLGVSFPNASFTQASCIPVLEESVDVSKEGLAGNGLKQSELRANRFYEFSEFGRGFGRHQTEQSLAARVAAPRRSQQKDSALQCFVVLNKTRWYMLLRGRILGGSADVKEHERSDNAIESTPSFDETGTSESSVTSEICKREQSVSNNQKQNCPEGIFPKYAPCMVREFHGKFRVTARTAILELPEYFKAARAAYKWLSRMKHQVEGKTFGRSSPSRESRKAISVERGLRKQPHGGQISYGVLGNESNETGEVSSISDEQ